MNDPVESAASFPELPRAAGPELGPDAGQKLAAAPADLPPPSRNSEQLALGVGALLAALAIIWIARPVGIGILLGTLSAFTLQPFYRTMRARWRRPVVAALVCVGGILLTIALSLLGFGYLLIGRGVGRIRELVSSLQPGGALRHFLERLVKWLTHLGIEPQRLADQVRDATAEASVRLASLATTVAGTTFAILLAIFFLVLSMFFVLLNWSALSRRAEIMLPLRPRDTRALFDEFRRVGRTVLLGTVLTGLAQGLLATIGYFITRVPEAPLLGALTTVASLLPGVGTLLVWVPAGIYLLLSGHVGLGIAELVYGAAVVVGVSDYIIRPRLVGGHGEAPALLTFVALFGGLEVFGLIGLILGPVITSLAVALLRIYEKEATIRRAGEVAAEPPPEPRPAPPPAARPVVAHRSIRRG
ncbi:MAG TPA: AI-2E family transporter [Pseudomonadota bacterium]|nr:AI-2E family transporter [Pseudomonadota bacterium]